MAGQSADSGASFCAAWRPRPSPEWPKIPQQGGIGSVGLSLGCTKLGIILPLGFVLGYWAILFGILEVQGPGRRNIRY